MGHQNQIVGVFRWVICWVVTIALNIFYFFLSCEVFERPAYSEIIWTVFHAKDILEHRGGHPPHPGRSCGHGSSVESLKLYFTKTITFIFLTYFQFSYFKKKQLRAYYLSFEKEFNSQRIKMMLWIHTVRTCNLEPTQGYQYPIVQGEKNWHLKPECTALVSM